MTDSRSLQRPSHSVVGVAANGRGSGVVVASNFVLTSDHCVNGLGSPAYIVDATGAEVVGRVCAKSEQIRLALLCCMPIEASVAALATDTPVVGAMVDIGSRTPKRSSWRMSALVAAVSAAEFTVQLEPDLGVPGAGDSGGPAFIDGAVVGILQEVRGERGDIAAYSAIPPVVDWVLSSIKQQEAACTKWRTRG